MASDLKASIIMPTYNGEEHIIEQLDSLRNQSYPIYELIIVDDGSTDGTVAKVENYIKEYQLTKWKITRNAKNLGWRENFFKLLNMADGEIIFPSDQDDIWDKNKVAKMVSFFEKTPNAQVLVSNYDELLEAGGVSYPCSKRKIKNVDRDNRIIFDKKNVFLNRPGWVYAIRKSFMKEINLYKESAITPVHDIAMWSTAVLTDTLYYLEEVTGTWRKHGNSAVRVENGKAVSKKNIRLGKLNRLKEITISNIRYLNKTSRKVMNKEKKIHQLEMLIQEYDKRIEIVETGKTSLIAKNMKSYTSLHPIAADIMFLIKNQ